MKCAVQLGDIAEQLLEITDQLTDDMSEYSIFEFGYTDDGRLAEVRLRKLTIMAATIYLTINAVRVSEEIDDTSSELICRHIEQVLNDAFIRTSEGTPYYVFPIGDYLDDHGLTAKDLAYEIYTAIHEAFLVTESFDSVPYQEIVSYFMEIPEDIELYDFTLTEQFRYRLGVNPDGRVRGLMVIVG